ncbi:MAG TPA: PaaI family thioesterase [Xanthobacteraceae bacterium]|nr:PaaI family thioesterase [Xanthobacteraceae bacterium]
MNPDQALLARFDGSPTVVDSNPLARALNTRMIALDRKAGTVTLTFEPGEQFVQGRGVVQGGIVATMLDFAAAYAALASLPEGQSAATASLTVGFQSAVRLGVVTATGMVERAGKRAIFTRAQLSDATSPLLASATAVMLVLPDRPAQG